MIAGEKVNRLTAVRFVEKRNKRYMWEFACDCGGSKIIDIRSVVNGETRSCGCIHRELLVRRNTKHGLLIRGKENPLYIVWRSMFWRCSDDGKNYPNYKARGITVCERWQIFQNFYDDMSATYQPGLTIERTNNDLGYSPENCIWGTRKVQRNNTRTVKKITFNGKTLNREDWAKELGGKRGVITMRILRGWSEERAVSTPIGV
jgi:hypothetical protein